MKLTGTASKTEIKVGHSGDGKVALVLPARTPEGMILISPVDAVQIAAALLCSAYRAEGKPVPGTAYLRLPR